MSADSPIRALIVDDERLARETLRHLLAGDPQVTCVGECTGGDEAIARVRACDPDLLFLDVQLPGRDGFDVLAQLGESRRAEVVFVTAFDEHALRAFDVRAVDYLLKPFDDERFTRALSRAKERVRRARLEEMVRTMSALVDVPAGPPSTLPIATPVPPPLPPPVERIAVRGAGSVTLVDVRDVDWIEAEDYYALLHVGAKSHLHREPLRDLEARLGSRFVRVHRSALVNVDRIREVRVDPGEGPRVVLDGGVQLRVSRTGRQRIEALLTPPHR